MILAFLLAALVAWGGPFACLLHCWRHAHMASASQGAHAMHMHHAMAGAMEHHAHAMSGMLPVAATQRQPSCHADHDTYSALTEAVLMICFLLAASHLLKARQTRLAILIRRIFIQPPRRPPRSTPILASSF
jgi:hypothetical protein